MSIDDVILDNTVDLPDSCPNCNISLDRHDMRVYVCKGSATMILKNCGKELGFD